MASFFSIQTPPQQKPASVHACTNQLGMSVTSGPSVDGFDQELTSTAFPKLCWEILNLPPTVREV
jgi:hypothetical protein